MQARRSAPLLHCSCSYFCAGRRFDYPRHTLGPCECVINNGADINLYRRPGWASTAWQRPAPTCSFSLCVASALSNLRWLTPRHSRRQYLSYATVLAVATVTIKLSNAGFVAGCFGLALFVAVTYSRGREPLYRSARRALSFAAVLFAGLVANGISLSGYPFYPSSVLPLPAEWRVPVTQANLDAASIALAGRQPLALGAHTYEGWAWFPDWLAASAVDLRAAHHRRGPGPASDSVRLDPGTQRDPGRGFLLLCSSVGGLAIWFWDASPSLPIRWRALLASGASGCRTSSVWPVAADQPHRRGVRAGGDSSCHRPEELSLMPVGGLCGRAATGITSVPVVPMSTFATDSGSQLYRSAPMRPGSPSLRHPMRTHICASVAPTT